MKIVAEQISVIGIYYLVTIRINQTHNPKMTASRKNKPVTALSTSGSEIFEQIQSLSSQGIDLLLKDFFNRLASARFHHLSVKDSLRLVAQIERKRELIHSSFHFQLKSNFADFKASRKSRRSASSSMDRQLLGLVGTNEYAESEELDSIASRFEQRYSQYYQSIAEQLGHCVNRSHVEVHENPMHVQCLCLSMQNAIESLNLVIAQKIAVYKLFAEIVVERLELLYKSLEECFKAHHMEPEVKTMSEEPSTQELATKSAVGNSVAIPHIPVLMGVFQSYKEKSNNTEADFGTLLTELKQTLAQREINDFDDLIDQLSAIFEIVFNDEDIPGRIKQQIARLQIFIFMSEIKQNGFAVHSSHPARRLIETIIRSEVDFELEGLSDRSGYDFLREEIDKISNNPFIESHTYAEICEAYIEKTCGESEQPAPAMETVIDIVAPLPPEPEILEEIELCAEDIPAAGKKVEGNYAVVMSIVNDLTLPLRIQGRSLILFDEVWSPLLLEVAGAQGFKSQAWQKLMTIAKTQAWVLTTKTSQIELDKLIATLPHVKKSLTQSMQSLEVPADQQASLLEFLEHEQADVIAQTRAHIKECKEAEPPIFKPVAKKPETHEHSSDNQKNDQLADTIDEFSSLMQTGRFKKSKDMLKALDSDKTATKNEVRINANNIHKSDWVEIKKGNTSVLAKLTWKADDQSQYIFVDRDGQRVCEISREALDKSLESGTISLISSTPINSQRASYSVIQTI